MQNLVNQISSLENTFNSILIFVGQVFVVIVTLMNVIKSAKDANLEKAGSAIIQGIAFIILIKVVPSILQSFK